jgi:hypothetical protein
MDMFVRWLWILWQKMELLEGYELRTKHMIYAARVGPNHPRRWPEAAGGDDDEKCDIDGKGLALKLTSFSCLQSLTIIFRLDICSSLHSHSGAMIQTHHTSTST